MDEIEPTALNSEDAMEAGDENEETRPLVSRSLSHHRLMGEDNECPGTTRPFVDNQNGCCCDNRSTGI